MQSDAFMADGRCREVDPDVFYPEQGGTYAPAKLVCGGCEVQVECLAYALANMNTTPHGDVLTEVGFFGAWGGTTPDERRRMLNLKLVAA